MQTPAPPQTIQIDGITLVDDSAFGTKTRIAQGLARRSLKWEFFYATTPDGASPVALAEACSAAGKKLTLISTQPENGHPGRSLTRARELGACVEIIPTDDFRIVTQVTRNMAENFRGELVDFECDLAVDIIADTARGLNLNPGEVWSASARGAMARGYQKAWPNADHFAVVVLDVDGADFGTATRIAADRPFSPYARLDVPFRCNSFYEARAWPMARDRADRGKAPLFWNPAGP